MILRARIVLPVSQPPIEDGAVAISGRRIAWVGRWAELPSSLGGEVRDLGEAIILPGLINAHCHLDYTNMVGRISPPKSFSDWIKAMLALKAAWSYSDFAQSWLRGAQMLLRTGTTTVADVEAVPELIPDVWSATALRVISFRELISLKNSAPARESAHRAVSEWAALPEASENACSANRIGLSPHAPYTTTRELLQFAAGAARRHGWRLTTHVAESNEEFDMFVHRRGPLHDWLQSQRDMADCGDITPVQHLERSGYLSENLLAVHANYLGQGDARILGKRKVSVVHCPRSHAYFGHVSFSCADLNKAGVNVCLGTDSLVTALKIRNKLPELSLFAEMQTLAISRPEL